jgi:NTP pyrophosphatase (non-canonical NTP hydrolase)
MSSPGRAASSTWPPASRPQRGRDGDVATGGQGDHAARIAAGGHHPGVGGEGQPVTASPTQRGDDGRLADPARGVDAGDPVAAVPAPPPPRRTPTRSTRLLKLTEEVGEVAEAYIGIQGLNRRKGTCRTPNDLLDELVDVIITAAVAMSGVTGDVDQARSHFERRIAVVTTRAGLEAASTDS